MAGLNKDYDYALDAALQWFATWVYTGDERHRRTALACSQIAVERLASVKQPAQRYLRVKANLQTLMRR